MFLLKCSDSDGTGLRTFAHPVPDLGQMRPCAS